MRIPDDLRHDIRQLDELFRAQRTLSTKLEAVADIVQRVVPRCDAVSVSLIVEEASFTGASTSQLAIEADLVQYRAGEGPCLSAAREQTCIRIDALQDDEHFVHFAPGAVEVGVESVLSVPLSAEEIVGSLNLYSSQPHAFGDDLPAPMSDLVGYASDLIAESPLYEASVGTLHRMVEVVQHSTQVEIAVGILIVIGGLSPAQAWDHLRERADRQGSTIVECAHGLVEDHERELDRSDGRRNGWAG